MPEVTVVIPTHNRRPLLARSLSFAMRQRNVDSQIIVIDDGSIDSTSKFLNSFDAKAVERIRHDTPRGVAAARNRGVEAARGEWIAFLDDDDLWSPNKLRHQIDVAQSLNRDWVYCGAVTVDENLRLIAGKPPPTPEAAVKQLPYRNIIPAGASNVLVRRESLRKTGLFNPLLKHMADWDLWIRLAQEGLPGVVPKPLVAYQIHASNASMAVKEITGEINKIERILAERGCEVRVDRAYIYRWVAWNELRNGERWDSFQTYFQAVLSGDIFSLFRATLGLCTPEIAMKHSRWKVSNSAWANEALQWLSG